MYDNEIKYLSFLAEQEIEQARFNAYLKECMLISEGNNTAENLNAINEALIESVSNTVKKLVNWIGKLWQRFIENIDALIKKNQDYLVKYKDIILNRKLDPDAKFTMYDYDKGLELIKKTTVPKLNWESMKNNLNSKEEIIKTYFSALSINGAQEDIADQIKTKFRGSSKQVQKNSSAINMSDIYNYCYKYADMKKQLKSDINTIKESANIAIDTANKLAKVYSESSSYYSFVKESFITEVENKQPLVGIENPADKEADAKPNDNKNTTGEDTNNTNTIKNSVNSKESADDVVKKVSNYLSVCGTVLAAKQTILQEIFNANMYIIRWHVKQNISEGKNDSRKVNKTTDSKSEESGDIKKHINDTLK